MGGGAFSCLVKNSPFGQPTKISSGLRYRLCSDFAILFKVHSVTMTNVTGLTTLRQRMEASHTADTGIIQNHFDCLHMAARQLIANMTGSYCETIIGKICGLIAVSRAT